MPKLDWDKTRKLQDDDSIMAVSFIDGVVTKTELVINDKIRFSVGEEEFLIRRDTAATHNISTGNPIKGFLIEYCVPDDGATVFYFNDFHPMK